MTEGILELEGNMMIALKCLKVCPFKQEEFYLPRATPEGRASSRAGESQEVIFSSNVEVSRSAVSPIGCWGHRDSCESPVTGSNASKGCCFVILLAHPRYPKNMWSKGHPRNS